MDYTFRYLVSLLGIFCLTVPISAFTASYCSSQNTGTTDKFFWTWQSNGKCTDHCNGLGTFAYAVIQYTDCWCTNYAPAQQVSTDTCMNGCPGFGDNENCGNADKGLYVYIEMSGTPSGTRGGSQPTSSSVSSATPLPSSTSQEPSSSATSPAPAPSSQPAVSTKTPDPEIIEISTTVTEKGPATTDRETIVATSISLHTTPPSNDNNNNDNDQSSTTWSVTTESGVVITKTIVVGSTSAPSKTGNGDGGSNKGAIIGGVVGGILGLLAIIGAVLFVLWRKRKQRRQLEDGTVSSSGGITRNVSTLSKSGLLGTTTEKDSQYPPQLQTNFSTHGSRHDTESISPVTASDRRYSQPVMIDSRLDPRAVLTFHGANVSRDSLQSIDDSRDYGRQLNVRNPDP